MESAIDSKLSRQNFRRDSKNFFKIYRLMGIGARMAAWPLLCVSVTRLAIKDNISVAFPFVLTCFYADAGGDYSLINSTIVIFSAANKRIA